ncbi:MAG: hypothetical protein HY321_11085 [Armatimonadetes bacterium]|nr:hypothetical protein [Armatimonadota bacterium]
MAEERFREEQWFPRFVGILVGGLSAAAAISMLAARSLQPAWVRSLLGSAGALLGATGAVAPMRTEVNDEGLTVTFGLPAWIRFHIPAGEIRHVEAVSYRPLAEFGGWGIRFGMDGTRAYNARGDRGVRIETTRRRFLVGSQRPAELAEALRAVAGG